MGTRIWAATEPAPTTRPTAISTAMFGADADTTRPTAVTESTTGTSQRRARMSPSGTKSASPTA